MRNIPRPGTPSEAESGAQAATVKRQRVDGDLKVIHQRVREIVAALAYPGTSQLQKVKLRAEHAILLARKAAFEAELA